MCVTMILASFHFSYCLLNGWPGGPTQGIVTKAVYKTSVKGVGVGVGVWECYGMGV